MIKDLNQLPWPKDKNITFSKSYEGFETEDDAWNSSAFNKQKSNLERKMELEKRFANKGKWCNVCNDYTVRTTMEQTRSADEGMTVLNICRQCNRRY